VTAATGYEPVGRRLVVVFLALVVVLLVLDVRAVGATTLVPLHGGPSRVSVRYEPGLENAARRAQIQAEAVLAAIRADLVDLPEPHVIEIQVVDDASELSAVAPAGRGAPPWAIGVAYPDLGVVTIALRRGAQQVDLISTLRHELAHLALGAALGERVPHWLHEGFAYQYSGEWSWERMETLAGMAWFGSIVPLDELDRRFPAEEAPADRAYAESYDFVGYLSRRGRWEDTAGDGDRWPFRRFLTELGHGANLDTAAIRAFGRPIHALFDEWKSDMSKRYMFAPIGLLGLAVWVVCGILLALAYFRRRRHNRRRLAQWEREERARDQAAERLRPVVVPPYVAWPGEDPFAEDDDDRPHGDPKLPN
jgi:hypothetical protein